MDASNRDVGEAVLRWTDGDGPVVAFEATGVTTVLRKALGSRRPVGEPS